MCPLPCGGAARCRLPTLAARGPESAEEVSSSPSGSAGSFAGVHGELENHPLVLDGAVAGVDAVVDVRRTSGAGVVVVVGDGFRADEVVLGPDDGNGTAAVADVSPCRGSTTSVDSETPAATRNSLRRLFDLDVVVVELFGATAITSCGTPNFRSTLINACPLYLAAMAPRALPT